MSAIDRYMSGEITALQYFEEVRDEARLREVAANKIAHAYDVPPWILGLEPRTVRNRLRWRLERLRRWARRRR
jgi:hypothetical protein